MLTEKKIAQHCIPRKKKSFRNKGEKKIFFRQTKAERIHYQQSYFTRKVKSNSFKNLIHDRIWDLHNL